MNCTFVKEITKPPFVLINQPAVHVCQASDWTLIVTVPGNQKKSSVYPLARKNE